MLISIYNKNDGKFMGFGAKRDARVQRALANGHVDGGPIYGGGPEWMKWDFVAQTIVPDTDRRQADDDANQAKLDRKVRRQQIRDRLAQLHNDTTAPSLAEQVILLNEYVRT